MALETFFQSAGDVNTLLLLGLIIIVSGFVSGLSGFGFSAIGALCLWVIPPAQAIPLLMAVSMTNQMTSIRELRASMKPAREWWPSGPAPFILGGLAGIPAGVWLLKSLDSVVICAVVGMLLIVYSAWALFKPKAARFARGGKGTAITVGALGGLIGGFTAFPGSAVVVYAGLTGMEKNEQRSIVQPYILAMQVLALIILAVSTGGQVFDQTFWARFLLLAPIAIPFTKLGVVAFRKMSEVDFKKAVHAMLSVSGVGLAFKGSPALAAIGGKAILLLTPAIGHLS